MRTKDTAIPGVKVIEFDLHHDDRGSFGRVLSADEFAGAGLPTQFVQSSISRNTKPGTLRGMHLQLGPSPEEKLVRCISGRVFDVVVDLRQDSPAYCRWISIELDADSGRAVFIPGGCAHGFLTLAPGSDLLYLMTVPYDACHQHGVRWNDPAFAIAWPSEPVVISERDRTFPDHKA